MSAGFFPIYFTPKHARNIQNVHMPITKINGANYKSLMFQSLLGLVESVSGVRANIGQIFDWK